MRNPFHPIHERLESIDARVRRMSIGVDLHRYAYFDAVPPTAIYTLGDTPPIQHLRFEGIPDQDVRDS